MRKAAMILGIVGGLVGVFGAWEARYVDLRWFLFLFSPIGIAGGVLALSRPGVAGKLMLAGGVGCLVLASYMFILGMGLYSLANIGFLSFCRWTFLGIGFFPNCLRAGFLLTIGGVLALATRKKQPREGPSL